MPAGRDGPSPGSGTAAREVLSSRSPGRRLFLMWPTDIRPLPRLLNSAPSRRSWQPDTSKDRRSYCNTGRPRAGLVMASHPRRRRRHADGDLPPGSTGQGLPRPDRRRHRGRATFRRPAEHPRELRGHHRPWFRGTPGGQAVRRFLGHGPPLNPLVATHGDPNPQNLLVSRFGITLIDWDGAALSDPLRDVGPLLWWFIPPTRWPELLPRPRFRPLRRLAGHPVVGGPRVAAGGHLARRPRRGLPTSRLVPRRLCGGRVRGRQPASV